MTTEGPFERDAVPRQPDQRRRISGTRPPVPLSPPPVENPPLNRLGDVGLSHALIDINTNLVTLGERHLERVLGEYALDYHHDFRPHQGLQQRAPVPRARTASSDPRDVAGIRVLGGLHHDYQVAA